MSRKLIVLILAVIASTGLFSPLFPAFPVSGSYTQNCPGLESLGEMEDIMDNPEIFIGCKILVQGVLERGEGEDSSTYSLRAPSGRTVEVWPWAPEDDPESRARLRVQGVVRSMSSFLGRQLRIVGRLVQERSGKVVVEVSSVEELGKHTEEGETGRFDEEDN